MYATSSASTTSSSRAAPPATERRVRVVRLLRPRRSAPAFGFSLRGGTEHATGFFVSKVDFNSEAHLQGLKVGDQLVSVNGYRVDDAVHSELTHYLASQSRLKIKVRHVGMLPVKDKSHENLSWQFISEHISMGSDVSSSPTLCYDTERMTDLRLSILVPPRAKLGCGICKGPDWKPGIFVQFVREGGIAREAGLRPGDQILSCNGQDFSNITFNEAVAAMKAVGRLELVVREGAGTELVSPESSGYNSSASSAAGERSPAPVAPVIPLAPPAALRRRLASVAEEAADRADRLTINRLKRRTWDSLDFEWKNDDVHNFDIPSDIEPDYDCPSIPNNPHTYENKHNNMLGKNKKEYISAPSNKTIINLTEDGATIQSFDNTTPKPANYCPVKMNRDNDKKTIVVEVHHSNNSNNLNGNSTSFNNPIKKEQNLDATSISSSTSLCSAIAEELQRRKLKKTNSDSVTVPKPLPKPSAVKTVDSDKKKQHDALMDEFKKVHRKMFANQEHDAEEFKANTLKDERTDNLDRQPTLPLRKVEDTPNVDNHQTKRDLPNSPPPPPPMPMTNGHHENGHFNNVDNVITSRTPNKDIINNSKPRNGMITRTPTPDYNDKIPLPTQTKLNNIKEDKAELDSLESYKLKNPSNVAPRPPSNYFVSPPNGTATMKKHLRPVSVTIGEYGGRREPSKLEFLNGDKTDGTTTGNDEPITNRLQSELAMTLSRSNLRKKTEATGDIGR